MSEHDPENQNEEVVADEKAPAAEERQLLTVAETAALSGLSDRAIYPAISRGELRAVRICSRLRVRRKWFDEWLERSVVQPEPAFVMPPTPIRPGSFKALLRERQANGGGR